MWGNENKQMNNLQENGGENKERKKIQFSK